ncbi:MAG: SDR family NAD(P)-dependent oxidoreductase [Actinobacteria bacterium]|nr:SDR family NAD(P)-dependent oxidoreductase [Actinomycetota bacterium]
MTFTPQRSLVTGASAGLGVEFARVLAARGSDLVLAARRTDRLEELAASLPVNVQVVTIDLSLPEAGKRLFDAAGPVDLLVNNAGFGTHGALVDEAPERLAQEVALNVAAVVDATRAFLPAMIANGFGGIVNVASTSAFQPIPGMAVYGASKAFVMSFTEAVWAEARRHGVKVTALAPGATATEFFDVVGTTQAAVGRQQTAQQVIATAMRALDRRSTPPHVVSGAANAFAAWGTRLVPKRLLAPMAGRLIGFEG